MTSVATAEVRERVTRAIEEAQGFLGVIVGFLDEYERLRHLADTAQHECERLRQEMSELRAETERYRSERKEIADSLSNFIESLSQFKRRL